MSLDSLTTFLNDEVSAKILGWADAEGNFQGYAKGWAFTELSTAVYIAVAYLVFVSVGSVVMKSPAIPAFDPYPIKFLYNISQMFLCAYMTIEAFLVAHRAGYEWNTFCVPYNAANPPVGNLLYIFYISKIWDFWDTIFIVIGKKW
eukprot:CAMPEP_0113305472 /NCGR_PEP_ID=MMETSP0010_2-20120614/5087_1 /TAXON_ID=216773 ORGANISM="Corethron hystrix, Strain 308" /NCGR_SAMPLE_ID=MMETSP0010_2 /ASSEMBLY_ACC=CAM_ASM_000155 /LENGTH=145 /DNA_ID=CAMNT_0000159901 /DNA_START=93 /DNA_END=527 /DNA_ORIENTATION=- /assembly_acc=CAM_ASM_000155